MKATLINPNLLAQRNDTFTTGIVYMPIGLAYVAASLRNKEIEACVVDAFGERPAQTRVEGNFLAFGLTPEEVVDRIPADGTCAFLYANQVANTNSVLAIIRAVKQRYPSMPVVILENTQAVTAFSIRHVADFFFEAGADFVLSGEAEKTAVQIVEALNGAGSIALQAIPGLASREFSNASEMLSGLDELPFPAWDLFPVRNYWKCKFAHGPLSRDRYLPLLTSRGCPYPCKFCVVPTTNKQRWRARSPENVVAEIAFMMERFGVREFHIEDLDPTIDDKRIRKLCTLILERKLPVQWKIVAGTKVETMRSEETIDLMAAAGCRYISISPESGSARVLKSMSKPFKVDHARKLIRRMNRVGIRSQACFVLGFPGETAEDRLLSQRLAYDLTRAGLDEIALFIISPVPGSAIFDQFEGYQSLSQLNFTPSWREDFPELARFRLKLYGQFLFWKCCFWPTKILRQCFNFLRRRFETKMEMAPYRAALFWWRGKRADSAQPAAAVASPHAKESPPQAGDRVKRVA